MRGPPTCRWSSPSTRSTCRMRIPTGCSPISPPTVFSRRSGEARHRSHAFQRSCRPVSTTCSKGSCSSRTPNSTCARTPTLRPQAQSSSRASTSVAAPWQRCSCSAARSGSAMQSSPAMRGARCARSTTTRARSFRRQAREIRSRFWASTVHLRPANSRGAPAPRAAGAAKAGGDLAREPLRSAAGG